MSNSVAAAESERHFSGIVVGKRIRFSCYVTQGCAPEAETNDVSSPVVLTWKAKCSAAQIPTKAGEELT